MRDVTPAVVPSRLDLWELTSGPTWTAYNTSNTRGRGCVQIAPSGPFTAGVGEMRVTRYAETHPNRNVVWFVSVLVVRKMTRKQAAHLVLRAAAHLRLLYLSRGHDGRRS